MSMYVEKTAKSVEEAVALALAELQVSREEVEIEVLEEASKGVLGLFGGKEAKVRVTVLEQEEPETEEADAKADAGNFVGDILDKMDIDATISVSDTDDGVKVEITGDNVGLLIGRRGETLDAIQYLTSLVVNKGKEEFKRVIVDVENYRQKREETLVALAYRMANKVEKYKKSVTLEPMTPYERRIIHSALQERFTIETVSVGEEPNRKVVIRVKK